MPIPEKAQNEKRSFIRLKLDTMVSFTVAGKNERYQGRCKNISGAGLLFETEKKLSVGTKLIVIVPSDKAEFSNLSADVEVIRCTAMPDQHKFEVGVVIKQISS